MRYTLLGKTGVRVSELALGTTTFGEDRGWGASEETSAAIFERYVEAGGINCSATVRAPAADRVLASSCAATLAPS